MSSTTINKAILHAEQQLGAGPPSAVTTDPANTFSQNIRTLLGDSTQLSYSMNLGTLGIHQSNSRSTTGLPVAISGTAKVINQNVANYLAGFEDPIKAALSTQIVTESKIIIRRKYAVGGSTLIVPEHAPARTVSVREDARQVTLTRYGADIEMNLNLFLSAGKAEEELSLKMETQQEMLQQALISLGYERLMSEGTSIVAALQRSSAVSGAKSPVEKVIEADRIYSTAIFGCLSKNDFPLPNLMSILARAQVYTPNVRNRTAPGLLMVPPGLELSKFTRPSEMNFSVSGLSAVEHGKVSLPLSNVYQDPTTGIKVLVHYPPVDNSLGAASPQVKHCELTRTVQISMYYPVVDNKVRITDFKNRSYADCEFTGQKPEEECEVFLFRPSMAISMESAVCVNQPGESTGSLLYGYPSTGVSTSQTQEMLRIQLRVYLGSVLTAPENVTILNDIRFNGIIGGHGSRVADSQTDYEPWSADGDGHDLVWVFKKPETKWHEVFKYENGNPIDQCFHDSTQEIFAAEWAEALRISNGDLDPADPTSPPSDHLPILPYRGATFSAEDDRCITSNNGHLGWLDSPEHVSVLEGLQVYQSRPQEVVMKPC